MPPLDPVAGPTAAMIDVQQVAGMLTCSTRHVRRLADVALMPRPRKLGALLRFNRAEIEAWIADGCPSLRKGGVR